MVVTGSKPGASLSRAQMNISLPQNKVTSWSFKFLNHCEQAFIGISPAPRPDRYEFAIRMISGWSLSCNNFALFSEPPRDNEVRVSNAGKKLLPNRKVSPGDVVGVVMDTTKGELSFMLNGMNLGVAFEGIPLDKPLFPYVMIEQGNSIELDLSEVKENAVDSSIPVPSNVTTKNATWDTITLTWDAVEGATFYQIEVDGSKSWDASTANTFAKKKLLADTEHTFRVRAVRGNTAGEWSDVVKGKTTVLPDFSECVWRVDSEAQGGVFYQRGGNTMLGVDKKNRRVATCTQGTREVKLVGSLMLHPNKVTSWNIKVLSMKKLEKNVPHGWGEFGGAMDAGKMLIGVAPFYNTDNFCYSWFLDLVTFDLYSGPPHRYSGNPYGPKNEGGGRGGGVCVKEGDIIGVVMDTTKGELSFMHNGVSLGVAYEGIPLDVPLAPAVNISETGFSIELDPTEAKLLAVSSAVQVPGNVVVQDRSWNSITFAWDPVEGASAYQVEVDGNGACVRTMATTHTLCSLGRAEDHSLRVRTVQKNDLSEWSDVVMARTEEYPDFAGCVWRAPEENDMYELDEATKRVATNVVGNDECKVFGTIPLTPKGTVSWNVKVLKTQDDEGSGMGIQGPKTGILIGVGPYGSKHFPTMRPSFFNCGNFSGQIDVHGLGSQAQTDKRVRAGDTVSVVLDTEKGELSFYVNGIYTDVTYNDIPLDKPLVPCVVLWKEGDSVELDPSGMNMDLDTSVPTPSNITAKSPAWDAITLTWDAVEGASFYQVEVDGMLQRRTFANCVCTKRWFEPESEHTFRVRVVIGNKVSEWSDVVNGRTQKAPDFAACAWAEFIPTDVSNCRKYTVDGANPRVATSEERGPLVLGSAPLPLNRVCSWGVKVQRFRNDLPPLFGVAALSGEIEDTVDSKVWVISGSNLILSNSIRMLRGYGREYVPSRGFGGRVNVGDTVGVVMDTAKGELSFVLNGMNCGVAFEGIPLDKPLVPCVVLHYEGDSVEFDLSEMKENPDASIPVPSNLAAKSAACDSIELTWDPVEGTYFYQVEVDGCSIRNVQTIREMGFGAYGLFAETEHTFRVRAVQDGRPSMWSAAVKERTPAAPSFAESVWRACPEEEKKKTSSLIDKRIAKAGPGEDNGLFGGGGCFSSKLEVCAVIGSAPVPLNAVTSWSVKVLSSKDNDGKNILVGVYQCSLELTGEAIFCLDCYSMLYTNKCGQERERKAKEYGPRKEQGKYVCTGDSVGVVMDTTKGELSFVLDGVNCGVAFERIPLDKPLFPYASLRYEDDSVELII